jgi:hypothetical protein
MNKLLTLVTLGLALSLAACGGDACEDAADKLEECGFTTDGNGNGESAECTGAAECSANCFNDASCEDITSLDPNGPVAMCIAACSGG